MMRDADHVFLALLLGPLGSAGVVVVMWYIWWLLLIPYDAWDWYWRNRRR